MDEYFIEDVDGVCKLRKWTDPNDLSKFEEVHTFDTQQEGIRYLLNLQELRAPRPKYIPPFPDMLKRGEK